METVRRFRDRNDLALGIAKRIQKAAQRAIETYGHFTLVLTGGRTPRELYSVLASDEFAAAIDWSRVVVFWGDERCVPPDHTDSNYRLAHKYLLEHVMIPPQNINRMHGELAPEKAADEYEKTLRTFASTHEPSRTHGGSKTLRFDLVLLGMGEDGHTASLFPGTQAIHEQERWVLAHYVQPLRSWRITLTPMLINNARTIFFIIAGGNKAAMVHKALEGDYHPNELPAQIIQPVQGRLLWLLDASAARLLNEEY